MGDRRPTIRRRGLLAGASATGLGLVAGCMQPLLEEEPDTGADDGAPPTGDDAGGGDADADSSEQEGAVHVDDLELTEAWTIDETNATLYVTALDGEFLVVNYLDENQARVLGIDPSDGTTNWATEPIEPETHTPTLGRSVATDGETVFVGASGDQDDDDSASVLAFDRATGSSQWHHETDATGRENSIQAVVTLEDGVAYAADSSGSGDEQAPVVRRLDAGGTEQWADHRDGGFVTGLEYDDGTLVFATTQDLLVYDATSGDQLDSFDYRPAFAGPTRDGSDLFVPGAQRLNRIDLESGEEVWGQRLSRQVEHRPVIGDESVFLGAEAGYILAYDLDSGTSRWDVRLDGTIGHGPVLDGDTLWATDESGDLYAIDGTDGSIVHHRTLEMESFGGTPNLDVIDGVVLTEASHTALRIA